MKKGLAKVLAVSMAVFVMTCLFYGCGKGENVPTVTDPDGVTYLAVENTKTGETYAAIKGEDGKIYAAPIKDDGSVDTTGETFEVTNFNGTLPENDTTLVSVNDSQGNTYDFATGAVVTQADATTEVIDITQNSTKKNDENNTTTKKDSSSSTQGKTNPTNATDKNTSDKTSSHKVPATTATAKEEAKLLAEKYKTLFASGTYYIEFSTNDSDMTDPVTAAIKNGNIYMKTQLEGLDCAMIYKKSKDKVYVVLPKYRSYCIMSSDMVEDLDLSNFTELPNVSNVKVYEATVGDKDCLCERYESKSGESATYYFYKSELVRMDQTDANGNVSVMNIIKISSDVPNNLFELPKGYMPINLSMIDLGSKKD